MTQLTPRRGPHAAACTVLAAAVLAAALSGCGNTLKGAQQDTATDTQKATVATDQAAAKTGAAVRKAGAEVANAPKDVGEAAVITPDVKLAIVRDPVLNDTKNLINASTANGVVQLTGHVQSAAMKQRATEDAQAAVAKHHGTYTISNELVVGGM